MSNTYTEYSLTAQRAEDSNDPRGTAEFTGTNFSDMVEDAREQGYPRVISANARQVTEWQPVTGYTFAKATP